MSLSGAFTFMLHSHLPYARLAGRWPHGEEWIHEALLETYVPLLEALYDLKNEGVPYRLTIGITPVLAEQLIDADVIAHFEQYVSDRIAAAQRDMEMYEQPQHADPHLRYLAEWTKNIYEKAQAAFITRFNRNVIAAFRQLQDEGYIEIAASAATHAYLPLLARDSSISAQIKTGIACYERIFGHKPSSFWLPECGYRPAYINETGRTRAGIETYLAENGIKLFFTETHAITGGTTEGVTAGNVVGPYNGISRRYVIPNDKIIPKSDATTFQAYYASNSSRYPDEVSSGVVAIGRNTRVGQQVWSAEWGYPGDFDYREFYRKSSTSGIQYWRITSNTTPLGEKDFYHPDWAMCKIEQHAEHFAHLVGDQLRQNYKRTGTYGIVSANYDTELFGHWWFEGVEWLKLVLRHLAQNPDVEMTSASNFIETHPPTEILNIPESSWGAGGQHFVWDNNENHWMWQPINESELRFEGIAGAFTDPTPEEEAVLKQAARELMLLQSSDWQFLITTGQAREYALQRFNQHYERFDKLAKSLEAHQPAVELALEFYELDKVFIDVDYRWFRTQS